MLDAGCCAIMIIIVVVVAAAAGLLATSMSACLQRAGFGWCMESFFCWENGMVDNDKKKTHTHTHMHTYI